MQWKMLLNMFTDSSLGLAGLSAMEDNRMVELSEFHIDQVFGGGEPFNKGASAGEKFGEAIEEIGDAIKNGWNWIVDRVT